MNSRQIESLKSEYTDKYVVVDGARPELARFAGMTGQIKTINFGGRALVEFLGADHGWYDIELSCLRIVDKPPPPPEKEPVKPAAAKAATAKPAAKAPDAEKSAAEKPTAEKSTPNPPPEEKPAE